MPLSDSTLHSYRMMVIPQSMGKSLHCHTLGCYPTHLRMHFLVATRRETDRDQLLLKRGSSLCGRRTADGDVLVFVFFCPSCRHRNWQNLTAGILVDGPSERDKIWQIDRGGMLYIRDKIGAKILKDVKKILNAFSYMVHWQGAYKFGKIKFRVLQVFQTL